MKKKVALMAVCVFVVNLIAGSCLASAGSTVVNPLYDLTKRIIPSLVISSDGTAECYGRIKALASNYTIDITLDLLVKDGNAWKSYEHWSAAGATGDIELRKTCTVSAGTYKLKVTGEITSPTEKTETVIGYSGEKTYPV